MKSRGTAIAFALFLGGFGAHRFYLGQGGLGLLYLLFCWTLIPTLIAIIDIIVFIFTSQHAFDSKYNKVLIGLLNQKSTVNIHTEIKPNLRTLLNEIENLKNDGLITEYEYQIKRSILMKSL